MSRRVHSFTVTITSPDWLSRRQAQREIRAVPQGFTGYQSLFPKNDGNSRYLDTVAQGNGIRVRKVQ